MKWAEMSERKRDVLVHEKVMGKQIEQCTAPQYGAMGRQEIVVRCEACGYEFPSSEVTGAGEYGPDAYARNDQHDEPIPRYTTSMDDAWVILSQMDRQEKHPAVFLRSIATSYDEYSDHYGGDEAIFALGDLASLTPERICIAALLEAGIHLEW